MSLLSIAPLLRGGLPVRNRFNLLIWAVILLLVIGTCVLMLWASDQPRPHSVWAPDSQAP